MRGKDRPANQQASQQNVLRVVENHPGGITINEIVTEIPGCSREGVRSTVNRLRNKGFVKSEFINGNSGAKVYFPLEVSPNEDLGFPIPYDPDYVEEDLEDEIQASPTLDFKGTVSAPDLQPNTTSITDLQVAKYAAENLIGALSKAKSLNEKDVQMHFRMLELVMKK